MEIKDINNLLQGSIISEIKRTCDLIMISIMNDNKDMYYLHVECFIRAFNSNKVLLCSEDMYRKGRNVKRKFRWDKPNSSLFDDCIVDNHSSILNSKITNVALFKDELRLTLENDTVIEIMPNTVEDEEAYRLFSKEKEYLIV